MFKKISIFLLAVIGFSGCSGQSVDSELLMVSIQPLKYLISHIVGEDFEVQILVPPGVSPETYEPTPTQIKSAETANLLFFTGLIDFEQTLTGQLPAKERFVNLSTGIAVIEGSCSHGHHHERADHSSGHPKERADHSHGIDPHIWTSPKALLRMAETAYGRIRELYPDSLHYSSNYQQLIEKLSKLDSIVGSEIISSGQRSFLIFHPGLTYYARDYGLVQISLEQDGKEPSARHLQQIIEQARKEKITKVLYQAEFPQSVVEVAAAEIGAQPFEIDILGYDIVANIMNITTLIISE